MKAKNSIIRIALIVLCSLLFVQVRAQHPTTFRFGETAPEQVLRVMENNANALFSEINQKYDQNDSQLNLSSSVVTSFARNRIVNMWTVSHFYCTRTSMNTRVLKMVSSDTYQVRNIPVCFKEAGSEEYRYQYIVLEFDNQGKISDLYCALPEAALTVINITDTTDNSMASLRNRDRINTFLNNYFTAFICKDLEMIEKVFSDDLLVYEGNVLLYKKSGDDDSKTQANRRIEYNIQNKHQYMDKLRSVINWYSFINVKFDGVEIVQSKENSNVFGVRLNQYWYVSQNANGQGYGDEGKLFLLMDFTNDEQPVIWMRIWQPFKDANGSVIQYSEEDFFSVDDFSVE